MPPSATDHVLDELRNAILAGDLPAGETLRQEDLAERLGVSRMPVREAIKRLHAEGLVEVLPSRRVRAEHAALLEAARAGDAETAARLTEEHVRGAGARLLELF